MFAGKSFLDIAAYNPKQCSTQVTSSIRMDCFIDITCPYENAVVNCNPLEHKERFENTTNCSCITEDTIP